MHANLTDTMCEILMDIISNRLWIWPVLAINKHRLHLRAQRSANRVGGGEPLQNISRQTGGKGGDRLISTSRTMWHEPSDALRWRRRGLARYEMESAPGGLIKRPNSYWCPNCVRKKNTQSTLYLPLKEFRSTTSMPKGRAWNGGCSNL